MSNDIYWQIREERYAATMAALRETDHAFRTYGWTDAESAIRAVYTAVFGAPAPDSWSDALAQVARAAGGQVPAADEEIATAAPPPPPVVLTPLAPAPTPTPGGGVDLQVHKALVAQRALLAGTLALIDAELAGRLGPVVVVQQAHVDAAARLFLTNPAFKAAAAMLAFSAQVEP